MGKQLNYNLARMYCVALVMGKLYSHRSVSFSLVLFHQCLTVTVIYAAREARRALYRNVQHVGDEVCAS